VCAYAACPLYIYICFVQKKMVKEIFTEGLALLCDCLDNYCIEINSIECLHDSFTTVVINLRGEEARNLQTIMYSVLQKGEYQVELEGITYLLFCNSREYCSEERTTVGDVNVKDNNLTTAIVIAATILGILIIVLVLLLITFFYKIRHNTMTELHIATSTTNAKISSVTIKDHTNYNTPNDNFQTFGASKTPESSFLLPTEYAYSNQFSTSDAASSDSNTDHFDSGSPNSCTSLPTSSSNPLKVGDTEQITPVSECSSSHVSSLVAPVIKDSSVYSDHSDQTKNLSEPNCSSTGQFLIPNNTKLGVYSNLEQSTVTNGSKCLPGSKTELKPSEDQLTSQNDGTLFHDKSNSHTFSRITDSEPLSTGAISTTQTQSNQHDSSYTLPLPNKNGYYLTSIAMRSRTSPNSDVKWMNNVSYVSSSQLTTPISSNPNQSNKVHHYETIDEIDDKRSETSSQQLQTLQQTKEFVNSQPDGWRADKSHPVHGRCDFYSAAVPHSSRRSIENEKLIGHKIANQMIPFVADNTNNSVAHSSCGTNV